MATPPDVILMKLSYPNGPTVEITIPLFLSELINIEQPAKIEVPASPNPPIQHDVDTDTLPPDEPSANDQLIAAILAQHGAEAAEAARAYLDRPNQRNPEITLALLEQIANPKRPISEILKQYGLTSIQLNQGKTRIRNDPTYSALSDLIPYNEARAKSARTHGFGRSKKPPPEKPDRSMQDIAKAVLALRHQTSAEGNSNAYDAFHQVVTSSNWRSPDVREQAKVLTQSDPKSKLASKCLFEQLVQLLDSFAEQHPSGNQLSPINIRDTFYTAEETTKAIIKVLSQP
ncbi:hypothetical protein FWF89_03395 [Candidatus Saccharibacteria bacterium]|nr:hypothetical protein [Candidatus Saccharibacteria bacterium]